MTNKANAVLKELADMAMDLTSHEYELEYRYAPHVDKIQVTFRDTYGKIDNDYYFKADDNAPNELVRICKDIAKEGIKF